MIMDFNVLFKSVKIEKWGLFLMSEVKLSKEQQKRYDEFRRNYIKEIEELTGEKFKDDRSTIDGEQTLKCTKFEINSVSLLYMEIKKYL